MNGGQTLARSSNNIKRGRCPGRLHAQVRDFQAVIGRETRAQCLEKWGGLPDIVMACVGGGSNAMGIFNEFVEESSVRLIGVEVGSGGRCTRAARWSVGAPRAGAQCCTPPGVAASSPAVRRSAGMGQPSSIRR
jgi:hypothetical protein